MKKTLIIAGAIAALAAPSSALAQDETPSAKQLAQQACKEERAAVGKATFRATYGTATKKKQKGQNAHRNCVRQRTGEAAAAKSSAQSSCREERGTTTESRAAFNEKYGTNKNKKNAYGKCVSAQAGDELAEETADRVNASEQCKEERGTTDESKDAFREKYGTNKNKKNAFGKCVSAIAKAQQDDQPEA